MAVDYCVRNSVIQQEADAFKVSEGDGKLQYLFSWSVWPALTLLKKSAELLTEVIKLCNFLLSLHFCLLTIVKVIFFSSNGDVNGREFQYLQ